jgi:hypothetical protein
LHIYQVVDGLFKKRRKGKNVKKEAKRNKQKNEYDGNGNEVGKPIF